MTDTHGEAEQGAIESEEGGTDVDDPKERFRAALEAKREAQHRSETGRQNTGSVHGGEVPGGGHRVFRRRAGG
jgi:hypothetical protein